MKELLVKYSFGECSPEELIEIEALFSQHPDLRKDSSNMVKLDKVMSQHTIKIDSLESDFENKLSHLLQQNMTVIARPQLIKELNQKINIDIMDQKSAWEDYLAPILFGIASLIFVLTYGIQKTSSHSEVAAIFSNYSTTILLASVCLLGFFFLDQLLGKKQDTRNFIFVF